MKLSILLLSSFVISALAAEEPKKDFPDTNVLHTFTEDMNHNNFRMNVESNRRLADLDNKVEGIVKTLESGSRRLAPPATPQTSPTAKPAGGSASAQEVFQQIVNLLNHEGAANNNGNNGVNNVGNIGGGSYVKGIQGFNGLDQQKIQFILSLIAKKFNVNNVNNNGQGLDILQLIRGDQSAAGGSYATSTNNVNFGGPGGAEQFWLRVLTANNAVGPSSSYATNGIQVTNDVLAQIFNGLNFQDQSAGSYATNNGNQGQLLVALIQYLNSLNNGQSLGSYATTTNNGNPGAAIFNQILNGLHIPSTNGPASSNGNLFLSQILSSNGGQKTGYTTPSGVITLNFKNQGRQIPTFDVNPTSQYFLAPLVPSTQVVESSAIQIPIQQHPSTTTTIIEQQQQQQTFLPSFNNQYKTKPSVIGGGYVTAPPAPVVQPPVIPVVQPQPSYAVSGKK